MWGVSDLGAPVWGGALGRLGGLWGLLGLVVNIYFSVSNSPPGPRESWGPQTGHPKQREGQCKGPEAGLILRADPFSVLRPLPLQSARSLACSGC